MPPPSTTWPLTEIVLSIYRKMNMDVPVVLQATLASIPVAVAVAVDVDVDIDANVDANVDAADDNLDNENEKVPSEESPSQSPTLTSTSTSTSTSGLSATTSASASSSGDTEINASSGGRNNQSNNNNINDSSRGLKATIVSMTRSPNVPNNVNATGTEINNNNSSSSSSASANANNKVAENGNEHDMDGDRNDNESDNGNENENDIENIECSRTAGSTGNDNNNNGRGLKATIVSMTRSTSPNATSTVTGTAKGIHKNSSSSASASANIKGAGNGNEDEIDADRNDNNNDNENDNIESLRTADGTGTGTGTADNRDNGPTEDTNAVANRNADGNADAELLLRVIIEELDLEREKRKNLELQVEHLMQQIESMEKEKEKQMQNNKDMDLKVQAKKKKEEKIAMEKKEKIHKEKKEKEHEQEQKRKIREIQTHLHLDVNANDENGEEFKTVQDFILADTSAMAMPISISDSKSMATATASAVPENDDANDNDERKARPQDRAENDSPSASGVPSMAMAMSMEQQTYPLHIAHEINNLFSNSKHSVSVSSSSSLLSQAGIPKWNLASILQDTFFENLYNSYHHDAQVKVHKSTDGSKNSKANSKVNSKAKANTNTNSRTIQLNANLKINLPEGIVPQRPSQRSLQRKKRIIKQAVGEVYAALTQKGERLRLTIKNYYEEDVLRPILMHVGKEFVEFIMKENDSANDKKINKKGKESGNGISIEEQNDKLKPQQLEIRKLTTERNGYLDIIHTLITDNHAIQYHENGTGSSSSLPLHAVRYLEIMPWDDRSSDFIQARERLVQWQCFDTKQMEWSDKLRLFPGMFSKLPIDKMEKCSTVLFGKDGNRDGNGNGDGSGHYHDDDDDADIDGNGNKYGAGSSSSTRSRNRNLSTIVTSTGPISPSEQKQQQQQQYGVQKIQHVFDALALNILLTNIQCTNILDLSRGYPLPQRGEWEWCGNWTVEGDNGGNGNGGGISMGGGVGSDMQSSTSSMDSDEGWCYSNNISHLMHGRKNDSSNTKPSPSQRTRYKYRKRIWTRSRVLVGYPGISQGTQQMLKMNSHNAKLTIAITKMTSQVHKMQNKLMVKEEEMDRSTLNLKNQLVEMDEELAKNVKEMRVLKRRHEEECNRNKTRPTSPIKILADKISAVTTISIGPVLPVVQDVPLVSTQATNNIMLSPQLGSNLTPTKSTPPRIDLESVPGPVNTSSNVVRPASGASKDNDYDKDRRDAHRKAVDEIIKDEESMTKDSTKDNSPKGTHKANPTPKMKAKAAIAPPPSAFQGIGAAVADIATVAAGMALEKPSTSTFNRQRSQSLPESKGACGNDNTATTSYVGGHNRARAKTGTGSSITSNIDMINETLTGTRLYSLLGPAKPVRTTTTTTSTKPNIQQKPSDSAKGEKKEVALSSLTSSAENKNSPSIHSSASSVTSLGSRSFYSIFSTRATATNNGNGAENDRRIKGLGKNENVKKEEADMKRMRALT